MQQVYPYNWILQEPTVLKYINLFLVPNDAVLFLILTNSP